MRSIKYKAWDKTQKRWMTEKEIGSYNFATNVSEYAGVSWCGFTGLHDKNGKEIWEGDILSISQTYEPNDSEKFENCKAIVSFSNGSFRTDFFNSILNQKYCDGSGNWIVEVLGNIHEHPDLLK